MRSNGALAGLIIVACCGFVSWRGGWRRAFIS